MSNSLIQQAADINTHPDILRHLAASSIELARIVAKNPNTPINDLILLGANFPSELISNPVLPLLLLENPHLFQEMPIETLKSILSLDDVPEEYLVMAASINNADILTIIANHAQAPVQALSQIVNNTRMLKEAYIASQHINYAGEIREGWEEEIWQAIKSYTFVLRNKQKEEFLYNIGVLDERLLLGLFPDTHFNIAANLETPPHIAELIISTFDSETKAELNLIKASNPNTPVNNLIEYSNTKSIKLVAAVAGNPSVPVFVLEKLARMDGQEIRQATYRNYNTSLSILNILYNETKSIEQNAQHIKYALLTCLENYQKSKSLFYLNSFKINNICIHLSLAESILNYVYQQLGGIANLDILIAFARRTDTPKHILEHIYVQSRCRKRDSSKTDNVKKTLRVLLARNLQTPIDTLVYLVEDDYYEVRNEAIINLKTNFALYNQQVAEFLQMWEYANNPATPQTILSNIVANYFKSISLCLAIANNPNTSPETLHQLVSHAEHDVLTAVTKNPNTSVETLLILSKKRKGFFNIRAHAMKALIHKDTQKAGAVLTEFVSSNEPTSPRFILLLHPLAPSSFLRQHANSISWIERYAIAQNNNTPFAVLEKLATDVNRLVRAVAITKLS